MLFLGDGDTISRCPLLNILDSGGNIPASFGGIVNYQGHLDDGNKKDGTFICNKFLKHMREIDPTKQLSDIVMFDGDSNVQLSGRLFKVHYHKFTVMCFVEHIVSLTFVFLAEIKLGFLDISWRCTETSGCENFFNPLYPLQNSPLFLPIKN